MSLLSVKEILPEDIQPQVETNKFVCDLCDKIFDKRGPMANHRIHIHTVRSTELYCDFCDEVFNNKVDLCTHMSDKHAEHFIKKEQDNNHTTKEEFIKIQPTTGEAGAEAACCEDNTDSQVRLS